MEHTILNDKSQIIGHIYKIINIVNNKYYVGQAVSHRKNHGKYRPFGFEGRFKDHISEALCNTKKKQCTYLNNAIRHYGKDNFKVILLKRTSIELLNNYEQHYIDKYNTLYPNGYNLTKGGKTFFKDIVVNNSELNKTAKRGGSTGHSEETKERISKSLKDTFGQIEVKTELMKRTQQQHLQQKYDKFKNCKININSIDQYIYEKSNNGNKFIKIKVGNIETTFVGKHESIDILRNRAIEFLKQVANTATLSN
jgi:hypothetical protein